MATICTRVEKLKAILAHSGASSTSVFIDRGHDGRMARLYRKKSKVEDVFQGLVEDLRSTILVIRGKRKSKESAGTSKWKRLLGDANSVLASC